MRSGAMWSLWTLVTFYWGDRDSLIEEQSMMGSKTPTPFRKMVYPLPSVLQICGKRPEIIYYLGQNSRGKWKRRLRCLPWW
jgi:hypothetical protein